MQENPISGCNPIYTGASTPRESRSNKKYQNFLMSKSQKTEVIYSKIIARSSNRWFPKKEPGVFFLVYGAKAQFSAELEACFTPRQINPTSSMGS